MKRHLLPVLICILLASPAHAEEIYFDGTLVSGELNLEATELFQFGPYGAGGTWGITNATIGGNQLAILTAREGAGNGGHGASIHLPYPKILGDLAPLKPGGILRFSGWLAVDPTLPANRQDWQFALFKFEFYKKALGEPEDEDALLLDTDLTAEPKIITSYTNALSATEWRQFHCEYTYDPAHFSASELQEIRPVVVQGDFTGGEFEGNVLMDSLRVEYFPNAAAAKASPADPTVPGPLKEASP